MQRVWNKANIFVEKILMQLDPLFYKLSSRIELQKVSENKIAVKKLIKSRVVKKDAVKIIDIAMQIKKIEPTFEVLLICSKNICSKSIKLLTDNKIEIIYQE